MQSAVKRLNDEIASLNKKLVDEFRIESDNLNKIQRAQSGINKNTSMSTLASKQREVDACNKKIASSKKNQATLQGQFANKQKALATAQINLQKEISKEQATSMKLQQDAMRKQEQALSSLTSHRSPSLLFTNSSMHTPAPTKAKAYDFFISHATEDKEEIAEPLYKALTERGATVWLDKFEMTIGDSLRENIDKGLTNSRYGIVILSKIYMNKFWTGKELNGLFAKWSGGDDKVILPIWHNISKNDVLSYSTILADMLAFKSADLTIEEMADGFAKLIQ